jgi:hypothetical protein
MFNMSRVAGFDFDYWAKLAQHDPEGFEILRSQYLQDAIERSSPHHRRRLEGLQFQLDLERRRAKTPMAACLKFSEMMMNSLHDELLPLLNGLASGSVNTVLERARESTRELARVIPFRKREPDAERGEGPPEV